jgi:DNA-binding XRE family transcriptional regulator
MNRQSNFDKELRKKLEDKEFKEAFLEKQQAMKLGAEIAQLRKIAGLSQIQLADRAGMHKQNIARIENPDYSAFTLTTLQRIAVALGMKLEVNFVKAH